jgi:hypothetical protein
VESEIRPLSTFHSILFPETVPDRHSQPDQYKQDAGEGEYPLYAREQEEQPAQSNRLGGVE